MPIRAHLKDRKGFTKEVAVEGAMYDGFPPRLYRIAVMPDTPLWPCKDRVMAADVMIQTREFELVDWTRRMDGTFVEAFYEEV